MGKKNYDRYIQDMMEFISTHEHVYSEDIPHMDLYMDQVTSFMDEHLGLFKRTDDEKILTKTMINNYSKCGILPPTDKKKYSVDHMIILLFIYYFKNTLSITDIQALLDPIKDMTMRRGANVSLEEVLDTIMDTQKIHYETLQKQVNYTVEISKGLFPNATPEEQEKLSIFTTAYLLSIQASAQKHMVTQLIDNYINK